ncbi:MAG: cytidylate kinase-like family protein [Eubacteriales bacterium]|nr:cytidylate kinase-like family protein [Eubacteriales bacterium]
MKHQIITISREFGSGGRTIGKQLAQKLGIPCYDEEIINQIAEESGLTKEFIRESGEYAPSGSWLGNALTGRDLYGRSINDAVWNLQKSVIQQLAEQGDCVIVGRCADYILRETADCLTVFIHASLEKRAERIVKVYGEREESPKKRLQDKDRRRKAYYQFYTDVKWGDVRNYQITLDSGVIGIEKCVEILADLYQTKREK